MQAMEEDLPTRFFAAADRNKDGVLSAKEIKKGMRADASVDMEEILYGNRTRAEFWEDMERTSGPTGWTEEQFAAGLKGLTVAEMQAALDGDIDRIASRMMI